MVKDVKIPEISENVTSGSIVEVLVAVGDTVAVDDVLVEMETEKAVVEIPSPYAGQISEVLVKAGDEKNIGDVIMRIEVSDDGTEDVTAKSDERPSEDDARKEVKTAEAVEDDQEAVEKTDAAQASDDKSDTVAPPAESGSPTPEKEAQAEAPESRDDETAPPAPAAPSVRRMARELGVDIHDVSGSGLDGRISQEDVHAYVKQRLSGASAGRDGSTADGSLAGQPSLPDFSRWGSTRTEKLATVRRLTAENTSASWRIVPQVTQFDEADISDVQAFLDRHGREAEQKGGKLTLTAVLMKVCAVALQRYPGFNASIDPANEQMIYKDYIHIGMAVDTPRGLLVPVIRDVQDKGIIELAAEIVDTAKRARNKKIKPEEFEGASFTISNQGGIGGTAFTPVVVWPQAAILGISRAQPRLVERDEEIVSRTILPLCVSYDHRIVDGADAARFLDFICRSLEQGLTLLL
jgi:pyruvate dehydrogenase E2 component (dihydrolipoamide acetyltransferase)